MLIFVKIIITLIVFVYGCDSFNNYRLPSDDSNVTNDHPSFLVSIIVNFQQDDSSVQCAGLIIEGGVIITTKSCLQRGSEVAYNRDIVISFIRTSSVFHLRAQSVTIDDDSPIALVYYDQKKLPSSILIAKILIIPQEFAAVKYSKNKDFFTYFAKSPEIFANDLSQVNIETYSLKSCLNSIDVDFKGTDVNGFLNHSGNNLKTSTDQVFCSVEIKSDQLSDKENESENTLVDGYCFGLSGLPVLRKVKQKDNITYYLYALTLGPIETYQSSIENKTRSLGSANLCKNFVLHYVLETRINWINNQIDNSDLSSD